MKLGLSFNNYSNYMMFVYIEINTCIVNDKYTN